MRFPLSLYSSLTFSIVRQRIIERRSRFPLVLMLEPTHRCNLSCAGCDRIRLHDEKKTDDLSLDQCIEATVSSQAPVVTITGGEPLLYGDLTTLVSELLRLNRHMYLCTNGILTESFIDEFEPDKRLTLNFHLDGMEETHDSITDKPGTFRRAVQSIQKAKKRGFRVSTNTSVYKNSDIKELESLFQMLKTLNVDGILAAPAFSYERVENDIFLSREEIKEKFKQMKDFFSRFPFINSPIYVDFLKGKRQMRCTPWGNPTRNPLGWKSPCYLITDTYYGTYKEMMEKTDWDRYVEGRDPRCRDCMVHCGYEATAMRHAISRPRDLLRLISWNLSSH
ncbi:MAG: adenosyl-hopene transferase HpnH [Nitrospiraceae bacterium]|nr:MAG: adenosyl-hopene transferase HpnH [Nitrospiraceae bacterium]